MRKGTSYTVSPGTGHHLFIGNGTISQSEFEPKPLQQLLQQQPTPPQPQQKPLPPPKKRNSKTLTLRHTNSNGNSNANTGPTSSTMGHSSGSAMNGHGQGLSNPKRVSVATSSFWDGHPDLGHLVRGWELGLGENTRPGDRSSLWGYTFDPKPEKSRVGASTDDLRNSSTSTLPSSSGIGTASGASGSVAESLNVWGDPPAVKKGILLQQRDKLLARWKERYCILTRDYLHCFRRTSSIHRSSGLKLSEMGNFIFKLRLAEIDEIEWETKRGCSMLSIVLPKEPRIQVRVLGDNEDLLRQWFTLLQECIFTSKERRRALRTMYSTGTGSATGGTGTGTTISSAATTADGVSRSVSLLSEGDSESGFKRQEPGSVNSSPKSTGSKMSTTPDNSNSNVKSSPKVRESLYAPTRPQTVQINSNTYDKSKTENKKKFSQLLDTELRKEDQQQQENKVVLRRDLRKNTISGATRTAEDFLRERETPQVPLRKSVMGFVSQSNGNGTVNSVRGVQLPSGYSYPVDFTCSIAPAPKSMSRASTNSRKAPAPRPESWAPSHHMIPIMDPNAGVRQGNFVPGHHWMSSSRGSMNSIGRSCGDYEYARMQAARPFTNCGGAMIPISTTPSMHTSEITFRKMC